MNGFQAWCVRTWTVLLASFVGQPALAQDAEALAWEAARERNTHEAYQLYLEEYPVGRFAGEAFRAMIELSIDQELGGEPDFDPASIY